MSDVAKADRLFDHYFKLPAELAEAAEVHSVEYGVVGITAELGHGLCVDCDTIEGELFAYFIAAATALAVSW